MRLYKFVKPLNRIWEKITGQVTGFFSQSIFGAIQRSANPLLNGVLFSVVSIFYMAFDSDIRKLFGAVSSEYRENKYWKAVVNDWLDNLYRFAIFIIIQELNQLILNPIFSEEQILVIQVVGFLIVILSLLLLITIFENYREKRVRYGVYNEHNSIESFLRAWDGIYGVFISFYTLFFLNTIVKLPNQTLVGIGTFVTVLSYFIVDEVVRRNMSIFLNGDDTDSLVGSWISKILDFGSVLLIFFSLEYIGDVIGVQITGFADSLPLQLLVTATLYLTVYTLFAIVTDLGTRDLSEQVWVHTIARVWPKISGTTTGIFSRIITEEIFDDSNRNIYVLATVVTLILYASFDFFVRDIVHNMQSVKRNREWKLVIDELLDFPLALAPLLTINVIVNEYLPNSLESSILDTLFVAAGSQMIVTFIFTIFRLYEKDYELTTTTTTKV